MKSALLALALLTVVSAQAQTLQWSSTNALPLSFSNASLTVIAAGDGAGGSAWLVNATTFIGPVPGVTLGQHLYYLDRSGNTLMTIGIGSNGLNNAAASLVRAGRNEVVVNIRGLALAPAPMPVNFLRRYTIAKNTVAFTDTAVELNENFSTIAPPAGGIVLTDKTGFFSYTVGTPAGSTIVMRRYSNK